MAILMGSRNMHLDGRRGSLVLHMATDHDDWIRHRQFGVGRVVRRDGASIFVDFQDGEQRVDRGMYRPVASDSLDVLSVVDPVALRERAAEAPGEIAVELLRAAPSGLTGAGLRSKLDRLGLDGDQIERWWLAAEAALRARSDIRIDGEPSTFQLLTGTDTDGPVAKEAEDLLSRLAVKRLTREERKRVEEKLQSLASASDLPPFLLAAAQALGVPIGPAPSLNDTDPRAFGAKLLTTLSERAGEGSAGFLLTAVLNGRSREAAEAAAARLRDLLPPVQVALLVSERLNDAIAVLDNTPKSEIGDVAGRLGSIVRRAELPVTEQTPALVRAMILLDAASQRTDSAAREVVELRLAIGGLGEAISLSSESARQAIERLPDGVPDSSLARCLDSLPLRLAGARLGYLSGLAGSSRRSSAFRDEAWRGLDLASLAKIAHEPVIEDLLATSAGRGLAERAIVAGFGRGRDALATLLRTPSLLDVLPDGVLSGILDRLAGSDAAVARIRDRMAAPIIEAAQAAAVAREAVLTQQQEAIAAAASQARDDHAAQVDRLRDEVVNLEGRLRRNVSSAGDASFAQLRQARIDGLTVAAEVLAELERLAQTTPGIDDVLVRLEGVASTHGLRRPERRGDLVAFDPSRHRMLVGDPSPTVEVVESTWVTDIAGNITAIRYGLMRGAPNEH